MTTPRVFVFVALAFLARAPVAAQEAAPAERRAVLAAVDSLFTAMTRRDSAASRRVMVPGAVFYYLGAGRPFGTTTDTEYLGMLADGGPVFLERIWNPAVRISGPIAMVWTRYDFHRNGKFSHCGVDNFSLVRQGERWLVASITYTVETAGCPESPLGPVS